jgi:hypothetical protein
VEEAHFTDCSPSGVVMKPKLENDLRLAFAPSLPRAIGPIGRLIEPRVQELG